MGSEIGWRGKRRRVKTRPTPGIGITNPMRSIWRLTYAFDAAGNTDTVTDALSRVTDNSYDPLNRLMQTIQNVGGLNVTTQFKYDARDNLTEVVDPKNLSTRYTYNGLGDLLQLTSPDTGITSYTYRPKRGPQNRGPQNRGPQNRGQSTF
ncbi:hypothetical protein GCM10027432_01010 [Lysobacter fragariae]